MCPGQNQGRVIITGCEPPDVTAQPVSASGLAQRESVVASAREALLWLSKVHKQPWFENLPSGPRRFDLERMVLIETQNGSEKETPAHLHIHYPHFFGGLHMVGAPTVLAITQLLRGVDFGAKKIAALGEVTVNGELPPVVLGHRPPQLFGPGGEVDVPGVHAFLCAGRDGDGGHRIPQKYNQGMEVKAFSHMKFKDMLMYAYRFARVFSDLLEGSSGTATTGSQAGQSSSMGDLRTSRLITEVVSV